MEALTKNRKKNAKKKCTGRYETTTTKLLPRECARGQNQKRCSNKRKNEKKPNQINAFAALHIFVGRLQLYLSGGDAGDVGPVAVGVLAVREDYVLDHLPLVGVGLGV